MQLSPVSEEFHGRGGLSVKKLFETPLGMWPCRVELQLFVDIDPRRNGEDAEVFAILLLKD